MQTKITQFVLFFIIIFKNVVHHKLRDKIRLVLRYGDLDQENCLINTSCNSEQLYIVF